MCVCVLLCYGRVDVCCVMEELVSVVLAVPVI